MSIGLSNLIKQAYNDMTGKGWDSGAQYSYCIQRAVAGDPQFWWVPETLRKFPHPPDWEEHVRNPDGTYRSFPSAKGPGEKEAMVKRFIKLAGVLVRKDLNKEARMVINLMKHFASFEGLLKEIEQIEGLLRRGTFNKLTTLLLDGGNLAEHFDNELSNITHEVYVAIIRKHLLEIISLLQVAKQRKDAQFIEVADKMLKSLRRVKNKHGL